MSSGSAHYTNFYASYRMNPNNFEGSDKNYVEKHNAKIMNIKVSESTNPIFTSTNYNNSHTFVTSSGIYMTHSYYGNNGNIITSCIG
jgi:hypothetical protein